MRHPLRILSVEDDPKDTELIQDLLETEGIVCEVTRVDTKAALLASLAQDGIDLILADYSFPSFDGISALKFAMKACPDVPFIFVSGTLGEELAIEALKIGATDYVLKTRLSRLAPSVMRALREATQRAERRRAEESLRRSETYLAEAQGLSHTGSFGWNVLSGEIYWSEETYKIFEYDRAVKPTLELAFRRIHPDDKDLVQQTIDRTAEARANLDFEHRLLMPDGSVKYLHVLARALETSAGTLEYVGAVMDVTERKRADEEHERLRQVQADLSHLSRVTTMGELTASLAHEINQPIGAAVANAEACLQFLERDQPDVVEAREAALEMATDARRAAEIIDRVRSLYRKGSSHQEIVDVNEVIREMVLMFHNHASRYSVVMRTELAEKLPSVMADRVQLQQVLMNLMLNGIEAMRDTTGELTIKSQLAEEGHLLVSVIDTGVGLPAGNADQIFDAFFTTKSQGTGLGLAITRSIVESHGGRVWATANPGRGATFQFTLPSTLAVAA